MKKHSGPASKEYKDLDKLQNRLADAEDNLIVGKGQPFLRPNFC